MSRYNVRWFLKAVWYILYIRKIFRSMLYYLLYLYFSTGSRNQIVLHQTIHGFYQPNMYCYRSLPWTWNETLMGYTINWSPVRCAKNFQYDFELIIRFEVIFILLLFIHSILLVTNNVVRQQQYPKSETMGCMMYLFSKHYQKRIWGQKLFLDVCLQYQEPIIL